MKVNRPQIQLQSGIRNVSLIKMSLELNKKACNIFKLKESKFKHVSSCPITLITLVALPMSKILDCSNT